MAEIPLKRRKSSIQPTNCGLIDNLYQQHEKICEFPSKQFYKGNLKTEKSKAVEDPAKEIWPVQDSPIVFCHVGDGVEEKLTHSMEEGHELSRKNKAEVDQVVRCFGYIWETYNTGKVIDVHIHTDKS